MKRSFLLATAVAAAAALPSAASAAVPAPDVPSVIAVTGDEKPFLAAHAKGVQIYACRSGAWALVAQRATLYGDNDRVIASHFGGPTWQARDGSSVVATRDAPPATVDPTAIPWLRLRATSTSAGADGDKLVKTSYVQRVATTGGLAPAASSCDAGTVGDRVEVPYTADYYFWRESGR